jgi:hypothetical protein
MLPGIEWRKAYFRLKSVYDILYLQNTDEYPEYSDSYLAYSDLLKTFFKSVYTSIGMQDIDRIFQEIEAKIIGFDDRDGFKHLIATKYPTITEPTLEKLLAIIENEIKNEEKELFMLKAYIFAEIIGYMTNETERLDFLFTILTDPKSIEFWES